MGEGGWQASGREMMLQHMCAQGEGAATRGAVAQCCLMCGLRTHCVGVRLHRMQCALRCNTSKEGMGGRRL